MLYEKSAGFLIFRKNGLEREYLLLHHPFKSKIETDFWNFPKGHLEKGETCLEAAKREVFEETGINDLKILGGFKKEIRYFFKKKSKIILKKVVFFLAASEARKIKLSDEHIGFEWLSFKKAYAKLTFDNAKEIIKKAEDFLSRGSV